MRPPDFWYVQDGGIWARALDPVGQLYAALGRRRLRGTKPHRAAVPVICIGNLTVGGTGKTPIALLVGRMLRSMGRTPAFLTRGYGGAARDPVRVDPDLHDASAVGDEALLLSREAMTVVAHDRVQGAELAVARGANVIVMDDGFQNPGLHKTLSVLVIDGRRLFGNGRVFPAGPLREPPSEGIARADAAILMDGDGARLPDLPKGFEVLQGSLVPKSDFTLPEDRAVVAFAGIGDPQKFFDTLARLGIKPHACCPFPDHHLYTAGEIGRLTGLAADYNAILVTTEKDRVRLPGEFARKVYTLPVTAKVQEEDRLRALLQKRLT